ncbi:GNAT family N-acetyltransferase [Legionella sp. CNM-1927-20]|uniref:GNAT family N-acetyltransferase n=1 Tax=Legionella sp. CNM-1927-20 TaxID=3422221 RepID=UPI00403AE289
MCEVYIRDAQVNDAGTIANLMQQLGYPILIDSIIERLKIYNSNPLYFSFIAELDNKVIGSISIIVSDYFHREGRFARIVSLVIDQNYRRKGIGKKLISYAENTVKKLNCNFIEVTSGVHRKEIGTHDFYSSCGYKDAIDVKRYFTKDL